MIINGWIIDIDNRRLEMNTLNTLNVPRETLERVKSLEHKVVSKHVIGLLGTNQGIDVMLQTYMTDRDLIETLGEIESNGHWDSPVNDELVERIISYLDILPLSLRKIKERLIYSYLGYCI